MESLSENKPLYYSLIGTFLLLLICAMEISPELNENMELVSMPEDLQINVIALMIFDLLGTVVYSRAVQFVFSNKPSVAPRSKKVKST